MNTIITNTSIFHTGNGSMANGIMTVAINESNLVTAPIMHKVVNDINSLNKSLGDSCRLEMGGFCHWPIEEIEIPKFQRPHEEGKIAKMAKNGIYRNEKEDIKKAYYDPITGKAMLLDGYHSYSMRKLMNVPYMSLMVYPLMTYQEAAMLFATQHKGTTRISSFDEYNALREAGDAMVIDIDRAFKECGVTFLRTTSNKILKNVTSIRKPISIYKNYGYNGLIYSLRLIELAGWSNQPAAYTEAALTIGAEAYSYAPTNSKKWNDLITVMKNCGSLANFAATATKVFNGTPNNHMRVQSIRSYTLHIVGA